MSENRVRFQKIEQKVRKEETTHAQYGRTTDPNLNPSKKNGQTIVDIKS